METHSMMDDGEVLYCTGMDDALIGYAMRFSDGPLAVYDVSKVIHVLMERDGMTELEAQEWYEVNMEGSWMGDRTPVFITLIDGG